MHRKECGHRKRQILALLLASPSALDEGSLVQVEAAVETLICSTCQASFNCISKAVDGEVSRKGVFARLFGGILRKTPLWAAMFKRAGFGKGDGQRIGESSRLILITPAAASVSAGVRKPTNPIEWASFALALLSQPDFELIRAAAPGLARGLGIDLVGVSNIEIENGLSRGIGELVMRDQVMVEKKTGSIELL